MTVALVREDHHTRVWADEQQQEDYLVIKGFVRVIFCSIPFWKVRPTCSLLSTWQNFILLTTEALNNLQQWQSGLLFTSRSCLDCAILALQIGSRNAFAKSPLQKSNFDNSKTRKIRNT